MNTILEYQNLIVLLVLVTFFANFCGLGLWIFLSVHLYTKTVKQIRQDELEYQIEKRKEAIEVLREMGKNQVQEENKYSDDDFGTGRGQA